jgi:hypothetical protein
MISKSRAAAIGLIVALGLTQTACVAAAVGTVAGAAIGITGAAVGATAKGAGMVVGAVLPGGGDKNRRR